MKNNKATPNKKRRIKPKVEREWGEDDIFKLIGLVEAKKCLWDTGDKSYHNKMIRHCAWRNIADHFEGQFTPVDLIAKWTNLRIQFRGYVGRAKNKSCQGEIKAPKWRFYHNMSFVGYAKDQQTQHSMSNIPLDDVSDSNSLNHTESTLPLLIERQPPKDQRLPQITNTQSVVTQVAETMREAVTAMKERALYRLDPNTTFSNYLLSELRTLSDEAAASVRKKVALFFLQCMEEERIKDEQSQDLL